MRRAIMLFAVLVLMPTLSVTETQTQQKTTVWEVAFVKAKDGQFDNYIKFLEINWVKARVEAQKQRFIVSYNCHFPKIEMSNPEFPIAGLASKPV
jgi:hypothetical protein